MPLQPPRIPLGEMDARQLSTYLAQSGIQAERTVKTFTPTWTGFSADPAGDFSYADFGVIVMIWTDSAMTGTSDANGMSFTGVPEAILPVNDKVMVSSVINDGLDRPGRAILQNDGTVFFQREILVTGEPGYSTTGFTATGDKGIPVGWLIVFSKG